MSVRDIRLKRLFGSAVGGSWGVEAGEADVDALCIRGTDFDPARLRVSTSRAPTRGYTHDDLTTRGALSGDLIIEKSGGGEQQPVGRAVLWDGPHVVMPTNFAARLRVNSETDSRFATYLLASMWFDGRTRASIKQTTGIQNLDLSSLLDQRIVCPDVVVQRQVADYLDRETVRIEGLVNLRRRMVDLLEERGSNLFSALLSRRGFAWPTRLDPDWSAWDTPDGWRVVRLSQALTQLTNGYVGPTRDILREEGIRYIQSLHIKEGRIDFSRGTYFVDRSWHEARPRIHLREGDVLIVQTGDIGQVAVVPPGFGEASCHALQIARVNPRIVSGPYLGAFLRSPFGQQSLLSRATGALHPHLEAGILDIPVVVPPPQVQAEVVKDLAAAERALARLRAALEAQLRLLTERRRALVSAAVSGQLDLPGVA